MKFTTAWAEVAAKNTTYKFVILVLTVACAILALSTTRLALQEPIVIERGCVSKSASVVSPDRSTTEIDAFVREAIARRFNSDVVASDGFLSPEEEAGRKKDLQALSSQSMKQRVLVNSVKIDGNQVTLDCDRVISVGAIRSALTFPLTGILAITTRSEANPYGLVLMSVNPVDTSKKEKTK